MRQDWEETQEMALFAAPLAGNDQNGGRCARNKSLASRDAPAFTVATDMDTGLALVVDDGENLLKAMERQNPRSAVVGCRNGGCGVCRVQLLSGTVQLGKDEPPFCHGRYGARAFRAGLPGLSPRRCDLPTCSA